jgi:hypothetical protein
VNIGGLSEFFVPVLLAGLALPVLVMTGWLLLCAYLRRKDARA